MVSSTSSSVKPNLLSLPEDVLSKIFKHLAGGMKYTLQSSVDALNLARTNTRLQRIFATHLTHITPITENVAAPAFSEEHIDALVRLAAQHLRVLHIPDGAHAYVRHLPQLCPNLEHVSYFEMHHPPGSEMPPPSSSSSDNDDSDDEDNDNGLVDNGHGNNYNAENDAGDVHDGNSDHDNNDAANSHNGNSDEENNDGPGNADDGNTDDANSDDGDNDNGNSDDGNSDDGNSDDGDSDEINDSDSERFFQVSEVTISKYPQESCAILPVLPQLRLRTLSMTRPTKDFFDHMTNHTLEELHLYKVKRDQLANLIPLLSQPLKALTVTVHEFIPWVSTSRRISSFIDALMSMVGRIASLTLHVPFNRRLETVIERSSHYTDYIGFPEEAASLIANARRNTCQSDCTTIDLKGQNTFRILSAVNRKASITLTRARVTVHDDGEGTHITGLPLDDEFLDKDVSHLEKAYILIQCHRLEHVCNPEWGRRLAGRRLRVIRTCDARVLSVLKFSTETLELFCRGLREVTDWTFLSGVRELYLLGIPGDFRRRPREKTIDIVEALPPLIDAFQGELIWVSIYGYVHCSGFPFVDDLIEGAKATKEATERFVKRGGDAGTLQRYIEVVLEKAGKSMKSASHRCAYTVVSSTL